MELTYGEAQVMGANASILPADSVETAAAQLAAGVTWTAELMGADVRAVRHLARQFGALASCYEPAASAVRMHGLAA